MVESGLPAPQQPGDSIGGMSRLELQAFIRQTLTSDPYILPSGLTLNSLSLTSGGSITAGGTTVIEGDGTVITTDGVAPGTSPAPTIVAGLGTLHVFWTGLTNADPVTYDVYVSTASGFTPASTNHYANTDATAITVKTDPTNSNAALEYGTTYYVKIIASDTDGAAPASVQASGIPAQADTADIAVDAITADQISANAVTADKLAAVLVLASTIKTAESGQRVEIGSAGVQLIASDGTVLIDLPSASGSPATFRGNVETSGLTVTTNGTLQGTNIVDQGATVTLRDSQGDPATGPSLNYGYDSITLLDNFGTPNSQSIGLYYDSAGGAGGATPVHLRVTKSTSGDGITSYVLLETLASTGAFNRTAGAVVSGSGVDFIIGVARCGTKIFVVYRSSTGQIRAIEVTQATFAVVGTTVLTGFSGTAFARTGSRNSAAGGDGTDLYIAYFDSSAGGASKRIARFNSSLVFQSDNAYTGITGASDIYIRGVTIQDGSTHVIATLNNTDDVTTIERFNSGTHALLTADGDTWSIKSRCAGITYNGSAYQIADDAGRPPAYTFTGLVWTPGTSSDTWWVAYEWYDSGSTGHTKLSPLASQTLNGSNPIWAVSSSYVMMRGKFSISVPTRPTGVTNTRTYILLSASSPTHTSMKRQTSATHVTSDTATGYTFINYDSSGTTAADTNTFSGGDSTLAGTGTAITAPWKLKGGGKVRLPNIAPGSRLASPEAGDIAFNTTTLSPEAYDGTVWRGLGLEVVSTSVNIASTTASTSGSQSVTISGLNVGDYCWFIGVGSNDGIQFSFRTEPLCATTNTIVLRYFNSDTATRDPAAATFYFAVLRRT